MHPQLYLKTANGGKTAQPTAAQSAAHPLKTSGFCSAKPKKKPPVRATISNLVQFWLIFTTKLESTSSVKPKSKPRRLFQQSWNAPRQKNPLHF